MTTHAPTASSRRLADVYDRLRAKARARDRADAGTGEPLLEAAAAALDAVLAAQECHLALDVTAASPAGLVPVQTSA